MYLCRDDVVVPRPKLGAPPATPATPPSPLHPVVSPAAVASAQPPQPGSQQSPRQGGRPGTKTTITARRHGVAGDADPVEDSGSQSTVRRMWPPVFLSDAERLLLVSSLVVADTEQCPEGASSVPPTTGRRTVSVGRLVGGRAAVLISLLAVHVQVWSL